MDKSTVVKPTPIIETTFDFARSCILLAAVELDVFSWIARGFQRPQQLAERIQASESALTKLLDALCAMEFLQKSENTYQLAPFAAVFLDHDQKTYIGDVVRQVRQEWGAWMHLTDTIRTGQSVRCINEETTGGPFFEQLDVFLFPIVYPLSCRICEQLGVGNSLNALQIADLGAGAAPGAIAALERDTKAHAVVIDFDIVLKTARTFAHAKGVEERMTFQSGDLEQIELPAESFDLIFASHTFRLLGDLSTQRLIKQCYHALKPGGYLIIIETYKEPDMFTKLFPHIVSINMLVNTSHGDTFCTSQMHEWLSNAGFQVEIWPQLGPDPIMVATRPQSF